MVPLPCRRRRRSRTGVAHYRARRKRLSGWLARLRRLRLRRPRLLGACAVKLRPRYRGRHADDPLYARQRHRLVRLFRALFDGTPSRPDRRSCGLGRGRPRAFGNDARRATPRRARNGRWRIQGLALRTPASRRNAGRMVDGRCARSADRSCRQRRTRTAKALSPASGAQLQSRRIEARQPARQCRGHQP